MRGPDTFIHRRRRRWNNVRTLAKMARMASVDVSRLCKMHERMYAQKTQFCG